MKIMIEGTFSDYQIQLAQSLSKTQEVALVLPLQNLDEELRDIKKSKIRLFTLEGKTPDYFPKKLWRFFKLAKIIRRFNPDVVHLQVGGGVDNLILLIYFKLFRRRPIISTFHDVTMHPGRRLYLMILIRYWIRIFSNAFIVHGKRLRQQMIETYKISPEKVFAVPIGEHQVAPFKMYERNDIIEDGKTILFFGRIYEYKGLRYLIEAEPMISSALPGIKVLIAGAGEDFQKYEYLIKPRKQNFEIHNYNIPYKEAAELFQRSSIVVLPYIEASQSGVVTTAYGFKKPVVVTDVGSIPEIVDNEITGLIVPPRNPEKLAEAIIRLLGDKDLRVKMGNNGYTKLKTELSFDEIAQKTILVYQYSLGVSGIKKGT
jgi:alpha-maltose-1-phosphate synthase